MCTSFNVGVQGITRHRYRLTGADQAIPVRFRLKYYTSEGCGTTSERGESSASSLWISY